MSDIGARHVNGNALSSKIDRSVAGAPAWSPAMAISSGWSWSVDVAAAEVLRWGRDVDPRNNIKSMEHTRVGEVALSPASGSACRSKTQFRDTILGARFKQACRTLYMCRRAASCQRPTRRRNPPGTLPRSWSVRHGVGTWRQGFEDQKGNNAPQTGPPFKW